MPQADARAAGVDVGQRESRHDVHGQWRLPRVRGSVPDYGIRRGEAPMRRRTPIVIRIGPSSIHIGYETVWQRIGSQERERIVKSLATIIMVSRPSSESRTSVALVRLARVPCNPCPFSL